MDIFHVLTMLGGLSLFLFGMSIMGQSLERRAGRQLHGVIGKLTTGRDADRDWRDGSDSNFRHRGKQECHPARIIGGYQGKGGGADDILRGR